MGPLDWESSILTTRPLLHWGHEIYPFPSKQWAFVGLFPAQEKNVLIKNMMHTFVFQENHKNLLHFWKKCKK